MYIYLALSLIKIVIIIIINIIIIIILDEIESNRRAIISFVRFWKFTFLL